MHSPRFLKTLNLNKILCELRVNERTSRVELSRHLNLGKSTITSLINLLIEKGCVVEGGSIATDLGRNPKSLRLNASWKNIIAIHIDKPILHIAILDLKGKTKKERHIPISEHEEDMNNIARFIRDSVKRICSDEGIDWNSDIIGVSIAIPGIIDVHTGQAWSRVMVNQQGISIHEILKQTFDKRVLVDNDVRSLAIALQSNLDNEETESVTLLVNKGVGAGIISNGKLIRGGALGAGQIGHIKIEKDGPLCRCGQRGCIESFISNDATIESFKKACRNNSNLEKRALNLVSKVNLDEITEMDIGYLAGLGVEEALYIVDKISMKLSDVIHLMVQILNPRKIFFAGSIFDAASQIIVPKISEQIKKMTQPPLNSNLVFETVTNYETRIVSGVANLVLNEVFTPSVYRNGEGHPVSLTDFF